MLVLTRHKYEKIKIGDDITIVIADIERDKVLIGIEAPKEIIVHRQEIYDAIQKRKESENAK